MLIDYGPNDHPIGIKLTATGQLTLDRLNEVMKRLGTPLMQENELAPLTAA